jgi:hypothetical protein
MIEERKIVKALHRYIGTCTVTTGRIQMQSGGMLRVEKAERDRSRLFKGYNEDETRFL